MDSGDTGGAGIDNATQQRDRDEEGEYRVLKKDSLTQASHRPMPIPDHMPADALKENPSLFLTYAPGVSTVRTWLSKLIFILESSIKCTLFKY